MLVKLGELHQPLCLRPVKNPGAAWGSACLDGPCEKRPNMVLEATVLYQDRRKAMLLRTMCASRTGGWSLPGVMSDRQRCVD
jgi:hypothetical protein